MTLARLPNSREILQLVVDGTYLYGLDQSVIVRMPITGGRPTVLAHTTNAIALAVDEGKVYWGTGSGLFSVSTSGGAVTTVASTKLAWPMQLIAKGGVLYWADDNGRVASVPVSGGTPLVLAMGNGNPGGLAADGSSLYWTESTSAGRVLSIPLSGGGVRTLASGQLNPRAIVVDGDTLYWVDGGTSGTDTPNSDGSVHELSLSGGPEVVLASRERGPTWIGIAAGAVLWVDNGGPDSDSALRVLEPGGKPKDLVGIGFGGIDAFALDSCRVYWAQYSGAGDDVFAAAN